MNQRAAFSDLVRERFSYLHNDYGFVVIHEEYYPEYFGNALTVMESSDCRIRILLEKGQVLIELGPTWAPADWASEAPDLWFDLSDVIGYLTQGHHGWAYEFADVPLDSVSRIDWQLRRLAGILEPYCAQVCEVFRPDTFQRKKSELVGYIMNRAKSMRGPSTK